jgi:hypothetical protein
VPHLRKIRESNILLKTANCDLLNLFADLPPLNARNYGHMLDSRTSGSYSLQADRTSGQESMMGHRQTVKHQGKKKKDREAGFAGLQPFTCRQTG